MENRRSWGFFNTIIKINETGVNRILVIVRRMGRLKFSFCLCYIFSHKYTWKFYECKSHKDI